MKKYKTKTVDTKIHISTVCDLCKKDFVNESWKRYDSALYYVYGDSYPEYTNLTGFEADICYSCFSTRILPALIDMGVEFTAKTVEY